MKTISSILLAFALLITLSACGEGGASFDISTYTGGVYDGTITATATLPNGQPAEGSPQTLNGSVKIEDLQGGRARLTITFVYPEFGPLPVPIEGTYDDNGAHFVYESDETEEQTSRIEVRIGSEGRITGSVTGDTATGTEGELSIAGSATASAFVMTWEGTTTENDGELPAGSEIQLAFDLSR